MPTDRADKSDKIASKWAMSLHGSRLGLAAPTAVAMLMVLAGGAASELTTQDVVSSMLATRIERQNSLPAYQATRVYRLTYHGMGHLSAGMTVRVEYSGQGATRLTLESETGSSLLRHRGLEPLLEAEQKDAKLSARDGSALAPTNYTFRLLDPQPASDTSYVLSVIPHSGADRQRFLFRGRIWVNTSDYGVERAAGKSVHTPSFWVRDFDFEYHAKKISGYWLPASEHCVTHLRFVGQAELEVETRDFRWQP